MLLIVMFTLLLLNAVTLAATASGDTSVSSTANVPNTSNNSTDAPRATSSSFENMTTTTTTTSLPPIFSSSDNNNNTDFIKQSSARVANISDTVMLATNNDLQNVLPNSNDTFNTTQQNNAVVELDKKFLQTQPLLPFGDSLASAVAGVVFPQDSQLTDIPPLANIESILIMLSNNDTTNENLDNRTRHQRSPSEYSDNLHHRRRWLQLRSDSVILSAVSDGGAYNNISSAPSPPAFSKKRSKKQPQPRQLLSARLLNKPPPSFQNADGVSIPFLLNLLPIFQQKASSTAFVVDEENLPSFLSPSSTSSPRVYGGGGGSSGSGGGGLPKNYGGGNNNNNYNSNSNSGYNNNNNYNSNSNSNSGYGYNNNNNYNSNSGGGYNNNNNNYGYGGGGGGGGGYSFLPYGGIQPPFFNPNFYGGGLYVPQPTPYGGGIISSNPYGGGISPQIYGGGGGGNPLSSLIAAALLSNYGNNAFPYGSNSNTFVTYSTSSTTFNPFSTTTFNPLNTPTTTPTTRSPCGVNNAPIQITTAPTPCTITLCVNLLGMPPLMATPNTVACRLNTTGGMAGTVMLSIQMNGNFLITNSNLILNTLMNDGATPTVTVNAVDGCGQMASTQIMVRIMCAPIGG